MRILSLSLILLFVGTEGTLGQSAASQSHRRPPLQPGGKVLLLGDSTLDLHSGDKRVEAVMQRLLKARTPHAHWEISNEAHGGEYLGPKEGEPVGVSSPLFSSQTTGRYFTVVKRHPKVDVVFVLYGVNDSKVYPPATFRKRLEMLCDRLEKDYPGVKVILCTGLYIDPQHSAPYRRDRPMVTGFKNGGLANDYFTPYHDQMRALAKARNYGLADVFQRFRAETAKGNWDLRLRKNGGGPEQDQLHVGDLDWFTNNHANQRGTEIIAEVLVEALLAGGRFQ